MFWKCVCGRREFNHRETCSLCGEIRPMEQHNPDPTKRFIRNAPDKRPPRPEEVVKPADPGYYYN